MTKTDHIAALLLDSVLTTIKVRFQSSAHGKQYTYKCLKTLAETLKVGDRVLVDTSASNVPNWAVGVCEVLAIDPEMDINLEADFEYKYAFAKVDESELSRLKAREVAIVEKINRGRQESIKQKMLKELDLPMSLIESIASDITPEDKAGTVEICEPDFSNPALQALIKEKFPNG
jgi:hypothetical protein